MWIFNVVTLRDPVIAKVMRKVQDVNVGKACVPQQFVSWTDVGAPLPGAATAIEDDELGLGNGSNTLAE